MTTRKDCYQQVEDERLPASQVYQTNDGKTTTNEQRQCIVSPIVAERKQWQQFGDAANDRPGVNSTTTMVGDAVAMDSLSSMDDDTLLSVASQLLGIRCRRCAEGHLSAKCPYKDHLSEMMEPSIQKKSQITTVPLSNSESSTGKYIPPGKRTDDVTIRVSNLPEETEEQDLHDLFQPWGQITRIYLAKDKINNTSRGFAFITFTEKREAQAAINSVNGFGYGHLILQVEWAVSKS